MSVRKSLAWSYSSQALIFLITFGTSLIMARLLRPWEFGIYAVASAISAILSVFLSFGIGSYLVREGEVTRPMLRTCFTVNACLSFVMAGVLFAIAKIEANLFHTPDVATILELSSIGPLINILQFVPSALCTREMKYGTLSVINVARTAVGSAAIVIAALTGYGAASFAVGPLIGGAVAVAMFAVIRPRDLVFRPSFHEFRPVVAFGLQMMSIGGVAQLASRASDLILGHSLGLAALGVYSRASNLSAMIFTNVYGQATGVIFSQLSRDLREKGELHGTFLRALRMITAVMWPLLIGLAVLARPAVLLLYGAKWLEAALPLSVLMIAQFVVLGFGMNWELFILRKETALQTRFEMVRAIAGTAAFAAGSMFSITAAAIGRLVEAVFGYFLYRPHMDRMTGTARGELERIYGESLALTAAAVIPSLLLMLFTHWDAETPLLWILAAVLTGVGAWLLLLVKRSHPLILEVTQLFRRFTARSCSPAP